VWEFDNFLHKSALLGRLEKIANFVLVSSLLSSSLAYCRSGRIPDYKTVRSDFLYWRPSCITPSKTLEEVGNRWRAQYISNNWRILHGLCRNGEKLTEQIDNSIELEDHTNDRPSNHHQEDTTKKGYDSTETILPRKESQRSARAWKTNKVKWRVENT
jgi:hypothetical protein